MLTRFRRGSNPGPSACEADVITTTLRNLYTCTAYLLLDDNKTIETPHKK